MRGRHGALLAGLLVLLSACSSATASRPDSQALALDAIVQPLAGGQVLRPTGLVYFRVIHFVQPTSHTFKSHQHVPGFVYVERGVHRFLPAGLPSQDVGAGEAIFIPSVTHAHSNPGLTSNSWYFIALWPTSAQTSPLVDPTATLAYWTPDFNPESLPQGTYFQTLRRVTLGPGGRTAAHEFGGMSVLYVLEGSLTVQLAGAPAAHFKAGDGTYASPNVGLQERNVSTGPTIFLELLTTAVGKPFEIDLTRPPSG